jgi:hypothetical protein
MACTNMRVLRKKKKKQKKCGDFSAILCYIGIYLPGENSS